MAKTVRLFIATMGGMCYRVTTSRNTAYYSTKSHHANTWKVKAKEPIAAFQVWAESKNLFSQYNDDNPALVYYRIQYLLHGYNV